MRLQGMKCTDAFYQNGLNTVLTPHWTLRRGLLPLSTSLYTSPVAWGQQVGVFSSSSGDGEHSEGKICTFHVISGGKNTWEMEVFAKFCMQNPHLLLFSHVASLHLTLWKLLLEHQQNFNIRSNFLRDQVFEWEFTWYAWYRFSFSGSKPNHMPVKTEH